MTRSVSWLVYSSEHLAAQTEAPVLLCADRFRLVFLNLFGSAAGLPGFSLHVELLGIL